MTLSLGQTVPNPRRVVAGKQNYLKRKGFSPDGLARLRAAALANEPWRFSTGPRTLEGKQRSALNGRSHQRGEVSVRQLRAERAAFLELIDEMAASRQLLAEHRAVDDL